MLEKLPVPYVSFEVKEALQRMGALLPMNIFLRQEVDRIHKVITEVGSHRLMLFWDQNTDNSQTTLSVLLYYRVNC